MVRTTGKTNKSTGFWTKAIGLGLRIIFGTNPKNLQEKFKPQLQPYCGYLSTSSRQSSMPGPIVTLSISWLVWSRPRSCFLIGVSIAEGRSIRKWKYKPTPSCSLILSCRLRFRLCSLSRRERRLTLAKIEWTPVISEKLLTRKKFYIHKCKRMNREFLRTLTRKQ